MSDDPEEMAIQIMRTMYFFGKGHRFEERKYYHIKVSFHPADRVENGGNLTAEGANKYALEYAEKLWPDREVVWSVQDHGRCIHIHFIVAACDQTTGKKLDARDAEYRSWKDYANILAAEYSLSTLNWRKATAEKRGREQNPEEAEVTTFTEVALRNKKKSVWKDELRDIIDRAVATSCTLQEFQKALLKKNVVLTRCSDENISYQFEGHKACRGDTLGGDYTIRAIRSALAHNEYNSMSAQFDEIDFPLREKYRNWGRLAGMKREEVDMLCDEIQCATWQEKQRVWEKYKKLRDSFWEDYENRKNRTECELEEAYRIRKKVRDAEWVLDPRNRRSSLGSVIIAGMFLHRFGGSEQFDVYISDLKRRQDKLREEARQFKKCSNSAIDILKTRNLSLNEYTDALEMMQMIAEDINIAGLAGLEYWAQRYNGFLNRGMSPEAAAAEASKYNKHRAERGDTTFQIVRADISK